MSPRAGATALSPFFTRTRRTNIRWCKRRRRYPERGQWPSIIRPAESIFRWQMSVPLRNRLPTTRAPGHACFREHFPYWLLADNGGILWREQEFALAPLERLPKITSGPHPVISLHFPIHLSR